MIASKTGENNQQHQRLGHFAFRGVKGSIEWGKTPCNVTEQCGQCLVAAKRRRKKGRIVCWWEWCVSVVKGKQNVSETVGGRLCESDKW